MAICIMAFFTLLSHLIPATSPIAAVLYWPGGMITFFFILGDTGTQAEMLYWTLAMAVLFSAGSVFLLDSSLE